MPRLLFKTKEQRDFLLKAKNKVDGKTVFLARICGVHPRTVTDWLCEKHLISQSATQKISECLKIKPPEIVNNLPDFWSTPKAGKVGAVARYKIFGNPGTKKGRSKGGKKSCSIQQEAAKKGILTGFVVRKKVHLPAHSNDLAEAVGIILGDGNISRFQIAAHSSAKVDQEYAEYIRKLFKELFEVNVTRLKIRKNTIVQVISSREIVEYLGGMGLKEGGKIKNNVSIPRWVLGNDRYLKSCLKGLFDTDGCIYYHRHYIRGIEYNDVGWEFRNLNINLLKEFQNFLLKKGFNSKIKEKRVAIYNRHDIHKYFEEIGSNNPKHIKRYLQYFQRLKERLPRGRRRMIGNHVCG